MKPEVFIATLSAYCYSVLSYPVIAIFIGLVFVVVNLNVLVLMYWLVIGVVVMTIAAIATLFFWLPVFFLLRKFFKLNYFVVVFAGFLSVNILMAVMFWTVKYDMDFFYVTTLGSLFGAWSAFIFFLFWNRSLQLQLRAKELSLAKKLTLP